MKWILSFAAVLAACLFLIPDARAGDCRDVVQFRQGFSGGYAVQQQFVQPVQAYQFQQVQAVQQVPVYSQRAFVRQPVFLRQRFRSRSRFSNRSRFFDSRSNRFGVELFRSRGLFGSRSGFRIGF